MATVVLCLEYAPRLFFFVSGDFCAARPEPRRSWGGTSFTNGASMRFYIVVEASRFNAICAFE